MKTVIIILLILFYPVIIKSQVLDSLIIKTHPMRDFVAFNPNIGFEKILSKKISIEAEFTYKNRDDEWGGKGLWDGYKKSYGYRIIIGVTEYFTEHKQIPKAWYSSFQIGYRKIYLPNFINHKESQDISEDINKKMFDINFLFGREFHIYKNIFSEFNIGAGLDYKYWHTIYLKNFNGTILNSYRNEETIYPMFYINWTIGYLISKKS